MFFTPLTISLWLNYFEQIRAAQIATLSAMNLFNPVAPYLIGTLIFNKE